MTSFTNTPHKSGRPVDPGLLETLGKQAAQLAETAGISLTEAVVRSIGHTKLNSEQVRRVVETTNVEAFHRKFAGLNAMDHRFVHIDGGPADPSAVIQELGNTTRPREVTIEAMEYSCPPAYKTASGHYTADTTAVFRTRAGAVGEVMALHSKLAAAHDEVTQNAEAARYNMEEAFEALGHRVKTAKLDGADDGEIFLAWSAIHTEMAKYAFAKLLRHVPVSVKVAGRRINPAHPVVAEFVGFVKAAQSYRAHVEARQGLETELIRVSKWLQNGESA